MPKRKRSGPPSIQDRLEKHRDEVFRALKAAKGFERQRLSKRLREDGIPADKKERLEREVTVLKSLDLHQTALTHLHASLLKIKSIAASTDLPEELRTGVAKPELAPEEQAALHNVTSGLYNREPVKQAVDRAVASVCEALKVPVPEKGRRSKKAKTERDEEERDEVMGEADAVPLQEVADHADAVSAEEDAEEDEPDWDDDESEFQGFESDVDEPGPSLGDADSEAEAEEEKAFSKYDHLLGSSSESDSGEEDEDMYERFKGREKVNLDDISLSGSASPSVADSDSGSDSEVPKTASDRVAKALSPSPKSTKKKDKSKKNKTKLGKTAFLPTLMGDYTSDSESEEDPNAHSLSPSPPPGKKKSKSKPLTSTALPSLMGGYISGSESASDIDVAPPKKRLGQKQRQAIWEKKFGAKAKHLQRQSQRDAGWDMQRGAVEADGGGRTPWKKGIRNPLMSDRRPPPVTKKDDEGPLHPSWEAAKKAKQSEKTAAFAGAKIVFD